MSATTSLLTVEQTGHRLGVSKSTVWRLIRCGAVRSVRRRGRRLVPEDAVVQRMRKREDAEIPPFTLDHPMWRLIGAGRSGGHGPGARNKHEILGR